MVKTGTKMEINPDLITRLSTEEKLWGAVNNDGSENEIDEDAVIEAASYDTSLGILTGLFMWGRKKIRNKAKTKEDLLAEKEAKRINNISFVLADSLLEYLQSAQEGSISEENLDELIEITEEMSQYYQAGKLVIWDKEILPEIRSSIAEFTDTALKEKTALPQQEAGTDGSDDFRLIRELLLKQKELIGNTSFSDKQA